MAINRKIRQGEIYWLDKCPALDGRQEKRRPVVVIGHVDPFNRNSPVLVVGISHTASTPEKDPDLIRLPDLQQSSTVKTGLTRPSWALPRWFLLVDPQRLPRHRGHYITGDLLKRLVAAVNERVGEAGRLINRQEP